jgi:outer membrane receptor protein involved in Fe transport
MTAINFDGAPMVTGANSGPSRSVDMRSQALNNISRIEVTKVPTPSTPADSLAGSVNMISKSAFERSGAEFRYGLYLVGNGDSFTLKKTPHAYGDKNTFNWKRLSVMPKWNYRGLNKLAAAPGFAPDAFQYIEASTLLDLNLGYRLSRRLSLSASINNLFNAHRIRVRYGSETPGYARPFQDFEYGALFSVGIKGSF